eukprot:15437115-Alexandrium_andersonii.AAC.1
MSTCLAQRPTHNDRSTACGLEWLPARAGGGCCIPKTPLLSPGRAAAPPDPPNGTSDATGFFGVVRRDGSPRK